MVLYIATNRDFWSHLAQFLEWEMFQTNFYIKSKHTFSVQLHFFPRKSCLVWDNVEKNIVQRGKSQMTIRRMRTECCIPKATSTHSEYVIFIAFPLQQWLYERASMLRYTQNGCIVCVKNICFEFSENPRNYFVADNESQTNGETDQWTRSPQRRRLLLAKERTDN
jgi:hypothetical protein